MVEETDKWIELIKKLKKLTANGKLRWHSVRPLEAMQRVERKVSNAFEAEYKDRNLRLYAVKDFSHYQEDTILELVDENGAAWEFPNIAGLDDLLETVRFQAAGVKEFIDAVLADETARP